MTLKRSGDSYETKITKVLNCKQQETKVIHDWEEKEDQFCLDQRKLRAVVRFQEHRTQPFDKVMIHFCLANDPKVHFDFE